MHEYGQHDMVAHMKTTIEIADSLLREAKRVAEKERTTLRALIEEGLRRALEERRQKPPFRLRDASYGRRGLRKDVAKGSWEHLRDRTYERRGT